MPRLLHEGVCVCWVSVWRVWVECVWVCGEQDQDGVISVEEVQQAMQKAVGSAKQVPTPSLPHRPNLFLHPTPHRPNLPPPPPFSFPPSLPSERERAVRWGSG
eukprot:3934954-Rhodomonas_salina.3